MPCFFNDANCNAFPHAANGWHPGGGADVCTFHYQQEAADIKRAFTFRDALLNDYLKIGLLMRDSARVLAELGKLNTAMGSPALAALQDPARSNYVKLSDALAYYERRCWFPDTHLILIGLLPGADFLRVLGSGYMAKDVGAGANHGEFSHRLQWHAIMRLATADFSVHLATGWNHSPYDLYCSFGEGVTLQRELWGSLLDRQGAADCRNPSHLDGMVRTSGLALLSAKLNSVFNKRIGTTAAVSVKATALAERETTRHAITGQRLQQKAFVKLGDNYASQMTAAAYAAHKGASIATMQIASQVPQVLRENADLQPASFTAVPALPATPAIEVLKELSLYEKPKWWKKPRFNVCMANGAMLRADERLLTPQEVVARRRRSRVALHP